MNHREVNIKHKQLITFNNSAFSSIFIFASLVLMLLPFINTFNAFLTSLFLKFQFYRALENFIVPYQAKALASILALIPGPITVYPVPKGVWLNGTFVEMQWNCLGWQSAVLLIATFLTGFQGNFSRTSRFETIFIGIMGTYLVNILRISIVGFLAIFLGKTWASLFHDYFSLIFVILWFFVFWWFSYSYVLEEENVNVSESKKTMIL